MLVNKEKLRIVIFRNLIKYFSLIVTLILLLIIVLSYYNLFFPKYQEIRNLREIGLVAKRLDLDKKSLHLKKFEELLQNHQAIAAQDLLKLRQMLPESSDLPGLFVQLQNLGQEQNLQLASVAVLEVKEAEKKKTQAAAYEFLGQEQGKPQSVVPELKDIKQLSVNLQYQVQDQDAINYAFFKNFLESFENNIRLFDINSLGFALSEASGKGGTINFNFTTYYLAI